MHIRARARRQKRIYLELDNSRELTIKFWFLGDFEAVSLWFIERLRHSPLRTKQLGEQLLPDRETEKKFSTLHINEKAISRQQLRF